MVGKSDRILPDLGKLRTRFGATLWLRKIGRVHENRPMICQERKTRYASIEEEA
jgi:hypothetical protein